MKTLNYNYVVFSMIMSESAYKLEDDYYAICLRDLENKKGILVNHMPLLGKPKLLRFLYRVHNSISINKIIRLPFKSIWYPFVFENTFSDNKPICFVCIRYPSVEYLRYLRGKYLNCKIVVMCRDLLKVWRERYDSYSQAEIYDYWMSYDEKECKKYGFPHFDEFESKIEIPLDKNYPLADLLFIGRSKGRLQKLLSLYDYLEARGVKCYFVLFDIPEQDKVERKGIEYISKPMSYYDMLRQTVNSKCVLDINQEEAAGYTSRFLEAVMFNKKLITNNQYIKDTKFYNPKYMLCIESEKDIDVNFLNNDIEVDYHYENEFSPLNRIYQIDDMLTYQ